MANIEYRGHVTLPVVPAITSVNSDTGYTPSQTREKIRELREYATELARTLEQPERLVGCKCALPGYEDHAGKCSGADCYCH